MITKTFVCGFLYLMLCYEVEQKLNNHVSVVEWSKRSVDHRIRIHTTPNFYLHGHRDFHILQREWFIIFFRTKIERNTRSKKQNIQWMLIETTHQIELFCRVIHVRSLTVRFIFTRLVGYLDPVYHSCIQIKWLVLYRERIWS